MWTVNVIQIRGHMNMGVGADHEKGVKIVKNLGKKGIQKLAMIRDRVQAM